VRVGRRPCAVRFGVVAMECLEEEDGFCSTSDTLLAWKEFFGKCIELDSRRAFRRQLNLHSGKRAIAYRIVN
jgi:hypothetical protein